MPPAMRNSETAATLRKNHEAVHITQVERADQGPAPVVLP